ncbi:hypothetical protein B0H12DRAFT_1072538 [Mycena haematopus]|nr:hypothetical protein B0H12DRAFT_1072538 [Mycena haematopus]
MLATNQTRAVELQSNPGWLAVTHDGPWVNTSKPGFGFGKMQAGSCVGDRKQDLSQSNPRHDNKSLWRMVGGFESRAFLAAFWPSEATSMSLWRRETLRIDGQRLALHLLERPSPPGRKAVNREQLLPELQYAQIYPHDMSQESNEVAMNDMMSCLGVAEEVELEDGGEDPTSEAHSMILLHFSQVRVSVASIIHIWHSAQQVPPSEDEDDLRYYWVFRSPSHSKRSNRMLTFLSLFEGQQSFPSRPLLVGTIRQPGLSLQREVQYAIRPDVHALRPYVLCTPRTAAHFLFYLSRARTHEPWDLKEPGRRSQSRARKLREGCGSEAVHECCRKRLAFQCSMDTIQRWAGRCCRRHVSALSIPTATFALLVLGIGIIFREDPACLPSVFFQPPVLPSRTGSRLQSILSFILAVTNSKPGQIMRGRIDAEYLPTASAIGVRLVSFLLTATACPMPPQDECGVLTLVLLLASPILPPLPTRADKPPGLRLPDDLTQKTAVRVVFECPCFFGFCEAKFLVWCRIFKTLFLRCWKGFIRRARRGARAILVWGVVGESVVHSLHSRERPAYRGVRHEARNISRAYVPSSRGTCGARAQMTRAPRESELRSRGVAGRVVLPPAALDSYDPPHPIFFLNQWISCAISNGVEEVVKAAWKNPVRLDFVAKSGMFGVAE